ncbi:MAG: glutathione binding-like protein, partial [Pseudomonadota bacterium]|nr:glutathione binding-like protein [Pseudomonadota bacterium]
SERRYLCGDEYTIADMANYAWYGALAQGKLYGSGEFLDVASYTHVIRWANEIEARPAVERGRRVNRPWGPEETRVVERHSAKDFEIKGES